MNIGPIILGVQKFINDNAGLAPKLQLEFMTKQTYPAAMIKSGLVNTVRRYIGGGGVYVLALNLCYKGQSFGDRTKAFDWLGNVGTFLEETSKDCVFRKKGFEKNQI